MNRRPHTMRGAELPLPPMHVWAIRALLGR
jgi:hypothetical protein